MNTAERIAELERQNEELRKKNTELVLALQAVWNGLPYIEAATSVSERCKHIDFVKSRVGKALAACGDSPAAANAAPLATPDHDGAPCAQCGNGGVHLCGQSAADAGCPDTFAGRVFVDQLTGKRDVQLSAYGKELPDMTRLYAHRRAAVSAAHQEGGA